MPIVSVVIAGGFNAYFTGKVCSAAFYLYRERFLAEKYTPDVIATVASPVAVTDPEEDEAGVDGDPSWRSCPAT
jgi:hypothetical protein